MVVIAYNPRIQKAERQRLPVSKQSKTKQQNPTIPTSSWDKGFILLFKPSLTASKALPMRHV
jgi:hypothetical protein